MRGRGEEESSSCEVEEKKRVVVVRSLEKKNKHTLTTLPSFFRKIVKLSGMNG
jgi:hypothetical protein